MNSNYEFLSGININSKIHKIKTTNSNTDQCLKDCNALGDKCDIVKVNNMVSGTTETLDVCDLFSAPGKIITCEKDQVKSNNNSSLYVKNNVEGIKKCQENPFVKNSSTPNVYDFEMFQNKEYVNDHYYLPSSKIKQHTRFSVQDIDVKMPIAKWGNTVKCNIPFHADLLNSVLVEIKLPKMTIPTLYWRRFTGNLMINRANLIIDNIIIAQHFHVNNVIENGHIFKKPNFEKMMSPPLYDPQQSTNFDILYCPLNFWFCKDYFNSLPLICLNNRQIQISIELSTILPLLLTTNDSEYAPLDLEKDQETNDEIMKFAATKSPEITLLCKYLYLNQLERNTFIKSKLLYNITYTVDKYFPKINSVIVPIPLQSYVKEIQIIFVNNYGHTFNPLHTIHISHFSDFNTNNIYYISSETNSITSDIDWVDDNYKVSDSSTYHILPQIQTISGFFTFHTSTKNTDGNHILVTLVNIDFRKNSVVIENFTNDSNTLFFTKDQTSPTLRFVHIKKEQNNLIFTKEVNIISGICGVKSNAKYYNLLYYNDKSIADLQQQNINSEGKFFYIIHIYGSTPGTLVAIKPVPDISNHQLTVINKTESYYENCILILNTKAPIPPLQIQVQSPYANLGPYSLQQLYVHELSDSRTVQNSCNINEKNRRKYARTSTSKNGSLLFSDSNQLSNPYIYEQSNASNPNDLSNYEYPSVITKRIPQNNTDDYSRIRIKKQRSSTSVMNTELLQLPVFRIPFSLNPISSQPSGHILIDDKWSISINDTNDKTSLFNLLINIVVQDIIVVQNNTLYFQKLKL